MTRQELRASAQIWHRSNAEAAELRRRAARELARPSAKALEQARRLSAKQARRRARKQKALALAHFVGTVLVLAAIMYVPQMI